MLGVPYETFTEELRSTHGSAGQEMTEASASFFENSRLTVLAASRYVPAQRIERQEGVQHACLVSHRVSFGLGPGSAPLIDRTDVLVDHAGRARAPGPGMSVIRSTGALTDDTQATCGTATAPFCA
jgi:hypothetical protein